MWHFLAQAVPTGGDWWQTFLTATGPAGAVALVLWKIRGDDKKDSAAREDLLRDENRTLTNRLFLLADRGMAVGQAAQEVAAGDVRDPELMHQMQKLEALLEQRGRA